MLNRACHNSAIFQLQKNSLALEVYKQGAVPFVSIFTDQLFHDRLTQVPAEYYTKDQRAYLSLLNDLY